MKDKTKEISKKYRMPSMHLDDLRDIEKILNMAKVDKLVFSTDKHEFTSVDNIPKDYSSKELNIRCFTPFISIHLREDTAVLNTWEDSLNTSGIVSKIDSIICNRERKTQYYLSKLSFFILICVYVLNFLDLVSAIDIDSAYIVPLLLVGLTSLYYNVLMSHKRFSKVVYENKNSQKNFWIKNKDKILVGVILAIFSSIMTMLATKYLAAK